jgi:hypothetical protein
VRPACLQLYAVIHYSQRGLAQHVEAEACAGGFTMLREAPGYLESCLQYGTYSWLGTNEFMVSSKLDSSWPPHTPPLKSIDQLFGGYMRRNDLSLVPNYSLTQSVEVLTANTFVMQSCTSPKF